jgi:tetratricopeptide (TPR) repeat protein
MAGALTQVEVARDAVDPMALALGMSAYVLALLGRRREADALVSQLERLTRAFGEESPFAAIEFHMSVTARADSDEDLFTALTSVRKAKTLARQSGQRRYDIMADMVLALLVWCIGLADEAERKLQALLLSDTEYGLGSSARLFILAWLFADRGALDEARAHAQQLVASGCERGLPLDEARGRWVLAEVLRRAGELDAADREVEAALAALGAFCPLDVPGVLATKAALRLAQGRPGEALAAAQEGLSRRAAMSVCSTFFRGAFLRLVHVESLEAAGQRDEARAALARARERLLSTAARIDDPAYQKSFLEGVPENRRMLELAEQWLGERDST